MNFFISYTSADRQWAEWIAWILEESGYKVMIQAWDFLPSGNFVLEMQKASKEADRTIALLSPDYLKSKFTQPEWAAAFAKDPTGEKGLLVPIRVRECELEGLLPQIIYIDLVGLDEKQAKTKLLNNIKHERMKPDIKPAFPTTTKAVRFPGALPPIWNVPHLQNPNFTGREELLQQLRKLLTSGEKAALTQTIHGLGGVGKTQLVLEYCYRHSNNYDIVWWIRSEDGVSLAGNYIELAMKLDLPVKEEVDQRVVIDAVKHWLGQNRSWLLVFDNAISPADIQSYLPQGQTGHVIITSRNPSWEGVGSSIKIETMKREESVAFLKKRTGQEDEAATAELAEELGDLPLALEQAGAYMKSTGKTMADYLILFRDDRQALLSRGKPCTNYPDTVATTWNISFKHVKELCPETIYLLNLCAFFAPDNIPRTLVMQDIKEFPASLKRMKNDPLLFDDAVTALRSYSLMEVKNDKLSLHRMVQAVVRDCLTSKKRLYWSKIALLAINKIFPTDSYDVKTWQQCIMLMPHARTVIRHINEPQLEMEQMGRLLGVMGAYLHGRADYSAAELLYKKALEIFEKQFGRDHPFVAKCLNNLAKLYYDQGNYIAAEPLYRKALEIVEKEFGKNDPDVATCLNNLASLLQAQFKYAVAEPLHRRALEIVEKQFGIDHPYVAICLNNLAALLKVQNKYDDAESLYRRALAIREQKLEKDHPDVANSLNSLAGLLEAQGNYAEANHLYRRALHICEEKLGKDHPKTMIVRNNYKNILYKMKSLE